MTFYHLPDAKWTDEIVKLYIQQAKLGREREVDEHEEEVFDMVPKKQ